METFESYCSDQGIDLLAWEADEEMVDCIAAFFYYVGNDIACGRKDGHQMELDVHVISDDALNALAASFGTSDVIAINSGTFRVLKSISRALVSHGLLTGDSSISEALNPIFANVSPKYITATSIDFGLEPLPDLYLEEAAEELFKVAVQFIFAHEFAHVYFGHTDWIGERYGVALVAEMEAHGLLSPVGMERETLEWDADCSAVQALLNYIINPQIAVVEGVTAWTDITPDSFVGDRVDKLQLLVVGLFICFALFASQDSSDPLDDAPRSHPHPLFRLNSAIAQIDHVMRFRSGIETNRYAEAAESALLVAAKSWEALFSRVGGMRFYFNDVSEFGEAFRSRLAGWTTSWSSLYPRLDSLKRGGRLAPPKAITHPAFPDSPIRG